MTEKNTPAQAAEKQILIFHTGGANGPLDTAAGRLVPGESLSVPEGLGKKLVGAYKYLKFAKDVIPGAAKDSKAASAEKVALEAKIKDLEKKLADSDEGAKVSQEKLALAVDEFLKAGSKKDLDALQEKHKDIFKDAEAPKPGA